MGSGLAVALLSGCVFAPSDPVLPDVGMRLDGGVLTVIVPLCPDDEIVSAAVSARSESVSPPSWTARDFRGEPENGIELSGEDWGEVVGDYSSLDALDITIETEQTSFGTVIQPPDTLDEFRSLPAGAYDVEGEVLTAEEFLTTARDDSPC